MLDIADAETAARAAAESYCIALHEADIATLEALFAPEAHLYAVEAGRLIDWPRQVFLDRVAARGPLDGAPEYEIAAVDAAGTEMARVRLTVAAAPRRYEDYLNFLKIDGRWRVIAKLFRVTDGPAL